ncbi:hypothetical protein N7451_000033 [Penicillium sp. IBT 35674x]|nr:hypothetical protein N7451_000033 [Penicillium sp. IBT 35674x]
MQGIAIYFLAAFAALSSAAAIGGEHLTERSCAGSSTLTAVAVSTALSRLTATRFHKFPFAKRRRKTFEQCGGQYAGSEMLRTSREKFACI